MNESDLVYSLFTYCVIFATLQYVLIAAMLDTTYCMSWGYNACSNDKEH